MGAQIHRFGDSVAGWLGTGETVYMTPADARKIGKALIAAAKDVEACKFTESPFKTVSLQLEPNARSRKEARGAK
jgi:hypothetical protein